MMDGNVTHLRYPWEEPPTQGEAIEIAEGILWMRLPLPLVLDHVNVYALDEGDSWTIIDTGFATEKTKAIWDELFAGPLKGKPVGRVVVTHHHPDHIGLAGWLMARFDAELITTRTSWLMARMLILDYEDVMTPEAIAYWRAAGMDEEILQKRIADKPYNFSDVCASLPLGYTRLQEGDVFRAAGRDWDIHIGHGHAPEHLTMWSRDDNLVIAGDQIISSISPNIGVYPTEPDADPIGEWIESCARLAQYAREDHLVLSGHKLAFTGLPLRMHQMEENHHSALRRLAAHLDTPKVASDCFAPLFKRKVDEGIYGLALVETVAHLNHLHQTGRATRERREDGAWLWQAKA